MAYSTYICLAVHVGELQPAVLLERVAQELLVPIHGDAELDPLRVDVLTELANVARIPLLLLRQVALMNLAVTLCNLLINGVVSRKQR